MLRPSYSELMQILNDGTVLDNKITSRYAVVIAASKRARQLIDGAIPHATAETNKAVSVAVKEMQERLIKIIPDGDAAKSQPDAADSKQENQEYSNYPQNHYTTDEFDEDVELLSEDEDFADEADFDDDDDEEGFEDDFDDDLVDEFDESFDEFEDDLENED